MAASFAVAGDTTLAARLPFAPLGLASVLLALSLPFLLYARQYRWYALAMALILQLFEAEDRLDERRGWLRAGLVVTLSSTQTRSCAPPPSAASCSRAWSRAAAGRSTARWRSPSAWPPSAACPFSSSSRPSRSPRSRCSSATIPVRHGLETTRPLPADPKRLRSRLRAGPRPAAPA